jgi:hypothetical protein
MFIIRSNLYTQQHTSNGDVAEVFAVEDGLEDPNSEPMLIGVAAGVPAINWKGAQARWRDQDWIVEEARELQFSRTFTTHVASASWNVSHMPSTPPMQQSMTSKQPTGFQIINHSSHIPVSTYNQPDLRHKYNLKLRGVFRRP